MVHPNGLWRDCATVADEVGGMVRPSARPIAAFQSCAGRFAADLGLP
jgi:hypothetical protein